MAATALEEAITQPGVAALSSLLDADPEAATRASASGNQAIHYAAALNRADAIALLIGRGVDPNVRRPDGMTALHIAAALNAPEAVVELLSRGADATAGTDQGLTPLIAAARKRAHGSGAALLMMSPSAYLDPCLDARTQAGRACVQRGDMKVLDSYLASLLRNQPNEGVKFAYGMVKMSRADYARAAMIFEDIVTKVNPANARAHLELANAYTQLGRIEEARHELEGLLKHELPSDTRQRISEALSGLGESATVSRRNQFSGRLDAGYIDDSNVNVGPDSPTISIAPITFGAESITTLDVDEGSQPMDDQGYFGMVGLSGIFDVGGLGGWASTLDGIYYANGFDEASEQETGYYQAMLGFRRAEGRSSLRLPVSFSHIDRGDEDLADIVGFSPGWLYLSSDALMGTTVGLESRDYSELNDRDSFFGTLVQSWQRELAGRHILQLAGALLYEKAEEDIYSYAGGSVSVRDDWALTGGVVAYGSLKFTLTDYDEKEALAADVRQDEQLQWVVGLNWTLRKGLGLDLNLVNTENQSTFDLYEYERDVLTMSAFYSF